MVAASMHGAAAATCVGDCPPPDGRVAINELVLGVQISLGQSPLDVCASYDANGDGAVGVEELIAAVNNAQEGCPGGPTATPPPSPPAPTTTPSLPEPTTTPSVTATPAPGPVVGFFGVTSADDALQAPTAMDPSGIAIYQRSVGFGFSLVVEAQKGASQRPAGTDTFDAAGPPALQVQVTRDLGNGSAAVCDNHAPIFGGVPGIDPPRLDDPAAIAAALNDLGCRFIDGAGATQGRTCAESCVGSNGDSRCVSADASTVQFCGQIDRPLQFPAGDTLVTVRVRDVLGNLGPPAQLIIRIGQ
jgi:hypothetical protein